MATRSLLSVLFLLLCGAGTGSAFAGDAASLLVRVVNGRGRPVAEAMVRAGLQPEEIGGPEREVWQETAAEGVGRFAALPANELVWVLIERQGFVPAVRSVTLRAGEVREMQVALRPGGVAVGRVVDEAGRPVAGAEVEVSGEVFGTPSDELPAFLQDKEIQRTRTGPAGRFRFRDLPEGSFELALQHPSYVPLLAEQPIRGGRGGDLGRFVLRSGARLTGTVSDPEGRPIAGVPLWAVTAWTNKYEEISPSATTGPDGTFEILHLPPGQLDLHACGQGYLQESVTVRFVDEPVHLTLRPGATLSGRVVGPDGQPLAEVEISAFQRNSFDPDAPDAPWTPCPADDRASTDSAGRFTVGPLVPGWYELRVRTHDLLFGAVSDVRAAAGEPVEGIEIRLSSERAGTLAGRVLDPAGAPVAAARVTASTETSHDITVSAADGSYHFENVGRGPLKLEAEASGYEDLQRETELASAETRLDLILARDESCACTPVTVRGRVVGPEGTPVEGAAVFTASSGKAWTAADGRFELRSRPPLLLWASKAGFARRAVEVDPPVEGEDVEGLEIRLDTGTAIAGRLLGLTDEDLVPAALAVLSCDDGVPRHTFLRADGTFRFELVPSGSCQLLAGSGERWADATLVLEPGQGEVAVTLELAETYPVSGQVLDALGQPVAGAEFLALTPEAFAVTGGTRADGRFVLRLPAGDVHLTVGKEGLRKHRLELHVEGPFTGLEIRLEPGATVRGRLFGLAPGERPAVVALGPTSHEGAVELDSYTVSGLEPGTWTIEAALEDGEGGTRELRRTIEVLPGISEVTLDLDLAEAEAEAATEP